MDVKVYNIKDEAVGTVNVSAAIFGRPWNQELVYQALRVQEANGRKNVAHAKGRGEVRGGGIKPRPQKHSGRSRQGSIRSPIWKGGGASHGPTKERNFSLKISRPMRRAAMYAILSQKLREGELKVIDSLGLKQAKTKEAALMLTPFSRSLLLIPGRDNRLITRAARNLPRVMSLAPTHLNVRDLLKHKQILIEREALPDIH